MKIQVYWPRHHTLTCFVKLVACNFMLPRGIHCLLEIEKEETTVKTSVSVIPMLVQQQKGEYDDFGSCSNALGKVVLFATQAGCKESQYVMSDGPRKFHALVLLLVFTSGK